MVDFFDGESQERIKKYVTSIEWLRTLFLDFDKTAKPIMGIKDWDDAVCVKFGNKKLVVSVDGPYTKRLIMKSALIHASTDVVVKGARPLFALDTLIGNEPEIKEMTKSLKKQGKAMNLPILGGNTLFEDTEPRCNLTVVGELLTKKPIRDCNAKKGDVLALIGEPIWGSQNDRIKIAKKLFSTWFEILDHGIRINAAKDVTKGGLIPTLYEISTKSRVKVKLEKEIPFSMTRNLDNFLVSTDEKEIKKIEKICKSKDCTFVRIGNVS